MITACKNNDGFSLVEMMVVLVIIGLMTSTVVLVMPSTDTHAKDVLTEAQQQLTAVSRQAVISGQAYGIKFTDNGFDTLVFKAGKWESVSKVPAKVWKSGDLTSLSVLGSDVSLTGRNKDELQPHVWFLPTGERLGFSLDFSFEGQEASLSYTPSGFEVNYAE